MIDVNPLLVLGVLAFCAVCFYVLCVVIRRPSLLRHSRMMRGIFVGLVVWAVIGCATWNWGGVTQGFLRYDSKYAGYFRMIKAIAARDRTAVETELKTTSPNSHPPFDDAEDYVPALVYAVQSKDQAMVRLLLEHGADPNLGDCFEGAALTYAAVDDDVSMMTLLLHYGSTDQDVKDRALWRSSVEGKMNAVKVLLAHGADPDQILQQWDKPKGVGEPLSRIVVDQGHPEIAPLLLKASKKGKH